jgi:ABC-type Fe3+-hydroxamate transport system substrate-binding protein
VLVGGTKDPDLSVIADLSPDLIIVNTEENRADDIARCRSIAEVVETFPTSPKDVPDMLRTIGRAIDAFTQADERAAVIEEQIQHLEKVCPGSNVSFAYFIWKQPYMVASTDTYISRSLELAGFHNVIKQHVRYPSIELGVMRDLHPEVIFLSSEPYPFRQRDVGEILSAYPSVKRLMRIDGRLMSWYGTTTLELLQQLASWPNCGRGFVRDFKR